jgi:DNA-binding transcriptional regulator LsrR (DeoR family)
MDILAAILRAPQSTTQTAIAQQFSTSRQRVNQVLKSAQAANIPGLDRW